MQLSKLFGVKVKFYGPLKRYPFYLTRSNLKAKMFFKGSDPFFTIENLGNAELRFSGSPIITITGTDSDQISVESQPSSSTVAANAVTQFTIRFAPTSAGTKTASIEIFNNDNNDGLVKSPKSTNLCAVNY